MRKPDSSLWRPAPAVHTRMFDGEIVILDLARGEYMSLDAMGSTLWQGLERGGTIQEVARQIADEYDVTFDVALRDLEALVVELQEKGLLVPGPPSIP